MNMQICVASYLVVFGAVLAPVTAGAMLTGWEAPAVQVPAAPSEGPAKSLPTGADLQKPGDVPRWTPPKDEPIRFLADPVSNGFVTSGIGPRPDPIDGLPRFHAGLDIASRYGAPVYAAANGVVEFAGTAGGYGRLVVVQHDGLLETRYGHLSRILIKSGEVVQAGQIIGLIGSSGRSTGPHLHWEVRSAGQIEDPRLPLPPTDRPIEPEAKAQVVPRWNGWKDQAGLLPTPQ